MSLTTRSVGRRVGVVLGLVGGFWIPAYLGGVVLANVPIEILSIDPYTNPSSYHRTEVEPDTFSFGNTIMACTRPAASRTAAPPTSAT